MIISCIESSCDADNTILWNRHLPHILSRSRVIQHLYVLTHATVHVMYILLATMPVTLLVTLPVIQPATQPVIQPVIQRA